MPRCLIHSLFSVEEIIVETINGAESVETEAVNGLVVISSQNQAAVYNEIEINLPITYSRSKLPVDHSDIPTASKIRHWEHLKEIRKYLNHDLQIPVGLLIGANCPKAVQPLEVIPAVNDGPYVVRTNLGWSIVGPMSNSICSVIKCNLTGAKDPANSHRKIEQLRTIKEIDIERMFLRMYENDFNEVNYEKKGMSQNDRKFLEIMQKGVTKDAGHYVLPLPFKDVNFNLPNNRNQAERRCESVKRKMLKNNQFHQDYNELLEKMLVKGYAERADNQTQSGRVWYIPHQAIFHPSKGSMRVVFDCAAKSQGGSLNDILLSGLDLTNSLVRVLMRFREDMIPFTADVEAMFYQVRVPEYQ